MKKYLFLLVLSSLLSACISKPPSEPILAPTEQFYWEGEVRVNTAYIIKQNVAGNDVINQLPPECNDRIIDELADIYGSSHQYFWINDLDAGLSILKTSTRNYSGVDAYAKPTLSNNRIIPHVVVEAGYQNLSKATASQMLKNKYWGIIIQLDIPKPETLTGDLPLKMKIPAECWASAYGGH